MKINFVEAALLTRLTSLRWVLGARVEVEAWHLVNLYLLNVHLKSRREDRLACFTKLMRYRASAGVCPARGEVWMLSLWAWCVWWKEPGFAEASLRSRSSSSRKAFSDRVVCWSSLPDHMRCIKAPFQSRRASCFVLLGQLDVRKETAATCSRCTAHFPTRQLHFYGSLISSMDETGEKDQPCYLIMKDIGRVRLFIWQTQRLPGAILHNVVYHRASHLKTHIKIDLA